MAFGSRRGQIATEQLMTYSWAIVAMLVVIAVLYALGFFNAQRAAPSSCIFSDGLACADFAVDTSGNLHLDLGQATGRTIVVTGVGCGTSASPAVSPIGPITIENKKHAWVTETTGLHCANASGEVFRGTVIIEYTAAGLPFPKVTKGDVSALMTLVNNSGGTSNAPADGGSWVLVPGNPGNPNCSATSFYVMAYEAKNNGSGKAVSSSNGTPWISINQSNARAACTAVGGHLLTIAEAQTINLNVAAQAGNWMSGSVGTGCMYGGHIECNGPPCDILFNASPDNNQGYWNGTSNSWNASVNHCPFNNLEDRGTETRRTYSLSTGEIIWDWSGNAMEWVDGTCLQGSGVGRWYYNGLPYSDSAINWSDTNLTDYERPTFGPLDATWDSSKGIGMYVQGCMVEGYGYLRGGDVDDGELGGIFAIDFSLAPSWTNNHAGFRCAYTP